MKLLFILCVLLLTACIRASIHYRDASEDTQDDTSLVSSTGGMNGQGGMDGIGGINGMGGFRGEGGGFGGDQGIGGSVDGPTGPVTPSMPGDLIITEIMPDTAAAISDDLGEWFEIFNPSADKAYDLNTCSIFDTRHMDLISESLIVMPGQYISLARFINKSDGGFIPTYSYTMTKFSDAGDKVVLTCGINAIDIVDFTIGFPIVQGKSLSLDPSKYDSITNNMASSWCSGKNIYNTVGSSSDYGTPGTANPSCN